MASSAEASVSPRRPVIAAPSKRNPKVTAGRKAAAKSEPTLKIVMEEENDAAAEKENRSDTTVSFTKNLSIATSADETRTSNTTKSSMDTAEPKKKKRKLLGGGRENKTIFDGEVEDEDAVPKPVPTTAATKRVKSLGGPKAMMAKGPLSTTRNAFGKTSFSPLKRDRRGVNASFLA